MIIVRAAKRPGDGDDGFRLMRETIAGVDREGGAVAQRLVVFDNDTPARYDAVPQDWRTVVFFGERGARASMWQALGQAGGALAPVLILEDDLAFAGNAVATMLGTAIPPGMPFVSFFYPVYAQPWEEFPDHPKPRVAGMESWPMHSFGWTQAVLLAPAAIDAVLSQGRLPAPAFGGPHGGDIGLRDALMAAGYTEFGMVWPNLVEHAGAAEGLSAILTGRPNLRSGWFAGSP